MGWLGYTRQKVSEYVEFVRLEITMVLVSHLFACVWIQIGTQDNGWVVSYVAAKKAGLALPEDNPFMMVTKWDYWGEIYGQAIYFIL